MEKKILIFTGAGISAPLGLPTTNEFTNTLNKIENELLTEIKQFFGGSPESNDIEKVLYLLEDFVTQKDFATSILQRRSANDSNMRNAYNEISSIKARAINTVLNIKEDIYLLLESYDTEKANKLYYSIIKEIKEIFGKDSSLSFFTTNYDLTFENGFADDESILNELGINHVSYGFGGGKNGKALYNPKEQFNWEPNSIEYKKLHGSLDWITDNKTKNCLKTGATLNPKNPGDMPMLYPGFKGIPSKQPFIDIHDKLYQRFSEAEVILVLGFAFRDDYINNVFEYSIRRNSIPIICYNPCKLENFPKDSRFGYFVEKYPETFFHIESKIELKDNPLNLTLIGEKIKKKLKPNSLKM